MSAIVAVTVAAVPARPPQSADGQVLFRARRLVQPLLELSRSLPMQSLDELHDAINESEVYEPDWDKYNAGKSLR